MLPASGPPGSWPVPAIASPADLARFLELEPNQLDWFADCQRRERSAVVEPLRHYRYRWVTKRSGSLRLIEAPKPRLKRLQRRVLDAILAHIPPHDAAHGFRPGRSVTSFVEPHVGRTIVLKMDLRDFFATITAARVMAIFLTAGYPEPVARLLPGCAPTRCRATILKRGRRIRRRSGSLARDRGLAGRAALRAAAPAAGCAHVAGPGQPGGASGSTPGWPAWRARPGAATRDMPTTWSSRAATTFARSIGRFPTHVAAIALEEGFAVQHRKTRVMRRGVASAPPGS